MYLSQSYILALINGVSCFSTRKYVIGQDFATPQCQRSNIVKVCSDHVLIVTYLNLIILSKKTRKNALNSKLVHHIHFMNSRFCFRVPFRFKKYETISKVINSNTPTQTYEDLTIQTKSTRTLGISAQKC